MYNVETISLLSILILVQFWWSTISHDPQDIILLTGPISRWDRNSYVTDFKTGQMLTTNRADIVDASFSCMLKTNLRLIGEERRNFLNYQMPCMTRKYHTGLLNTDGHTRSQVNANDTLISLIVKASFHSGKSQSQRIVVLNCSINTKFNIQSKPNSSSIFGFRNLIIEVLQSLDNLKAWSSDTNKYSACSKHT